MELQCLHTANTAWNSRTTTPSHTCIALLTFSAFIREIQAQEEVMSIELLSVIITIGLAIVGYIITHQRELALAKRKERLELINKQLNEFYGPLYTALESGHRASQAFFRNRDMKAKLPQSSEKLTDQDEWRLWVKTVILPLNTITETVILEKAYLIQEEKMPEFLLEFVAHTGAYRVLIAQWNQEKTELEYALISFPKDIHAYATHAYQELKREQLKLIGQLKARPSK
jgi:hypothetical protein